MALDDLMRLCGLFELLSVHNDFVNGQHCKKYHRMLILMNFKGSHMESDPQSKRLAFLFKRDSASGCH